MAYYSSYSGECNFNSHATASYHDYAQNSAFFAQNDCNLNHPCSGSNQHYYSENSYPGYVYDPFYGQNPNYPSLCYSKIAYSAPNFSDPKSVEYHPNPGTTQLVISFSNLEFNEPEFEEYDPTPYGGGYDLAVTYGKPLPPSDEICYPRSGSGSKSFLASDSVPSGTVVPTLLPIVEEGIDDKATMPQDKSAPQVTEKMPKSENGIMDLPEEIVDAGHDKKDMSPYESELYPGSGNAYSGEQSYYEYEKQVPCQFPSGYGLESLDICESLFGYWPCLARMKKRERCCNQVTDDGCSCREDTWKETADYLFGNPYPYVGKEEGGSSYGAELAYAYKSHYPSQAQYRQVEENS